MAMNISPLNAVFGNSLLVDMIFVHLEQRDLVQLSQTQKLLWKLVIPWLWRKPQLHNSRRVELFSSAIDKRLRFFSGGNVWYGCLVHELVFPKITYFHRPIDEGSGHEICMHDYVQIAAILDHCPQLKVLDMHTYMSMRGDQFEGLFGRSPLTSSLRILDISHSYIRASSILYALVGMPNLTKLVLNNTTVDDNVMLVISRVMLDLEWLNVCYSAVTESGLQELARGCQKLMHLECNWHQEFNKSDWIRQMRARGAYVKSPWEYDSDDSAVSDGDDDEYNLEDMFNNDFYSGNFDQDCDYDY